MNTAPSTGDLSQDLPSYLRPPFNKVRSIDHGFAYLLVSNSIVPLQVPAALKPALDHVKDSRRRLALKSFDSLFRVAYKSSATKPAPS
jgi:hypothetical protein